LVFTLLNTAKLQVNRLDGQYYNRQHTVSVEEGLYCLLIMSTATLVVQIEQSVRCLYVGVRTITFDLNDLWPRYQASSTWLYPGQVRRSRSQVKVHNHREKILLKRTVRPRVRAF